MIPQLYRVNRQSAHIITKNFISKMRQFVMNISIIIPSHPLIFIEDSEVNSYCNQFIMQTGRQDNEYKPQSKDHRFESSTKKPPNRIQIISKFKKSQKQAVESWTSEELAAEIIPLRRTQTIETQNKDHHHLLIHAMREHIEKVRADYQQRFVEKLKENSIEINRLQIKLQSNKQLIARKDATIDELTHQIQDAIKFGKIENPQLMNKNTLSPRSNHQNQQYLNHKVKNIEQKYGLLIKNQQVHENKMNSLALKIEKLQQQLIVLFGYRLNKLTKKLANFEQLVSKKIGEVEEHWQQSIKKVDSELLANRSSIKNLQGEIRVYFNEMSKQINKDNKCPQQNEILSQLSHNIRKLTQKLRDVTLNLQQIQQSKHQLKESDCLQTVNNSNSISSSHHFQMPSIGTPENPVIQNYSSYFDDYEQVFEELDSICDDKFFHPMDSSFRKPSGQTPRKQSPYNSSKVISLRTPGSKPEPKEWANSQKDYRTAEFNTQYNKMHESQDHFFNNKNICPSFQCHNSSFENFSSEDSSENLATEPSENPNDNSLSFNISRFIQTIKDYKISSPVELDVDINGMVKIKGEIKYLVDANNKFFVFNEAQLSKLRVKRLIS